MSALLTSLLGLVASPTGMCCAVPQARKLLRTSSVEGISLASSVRSRGALSWLTYGSMQRDVTQIAGNVVSGVMAVVLLVLLARGRTGGQVAVARAGLAASLLLGAALLGLALSVGTAGVGWLATVLGLVKLVPQARVGLSGADLRGVSPATCLLTCVSAVAWAGYGGDPASSPCSSPLFSRPDRPRSCCGSGARREPTRGPWRADVSAVPGSCS